MGISAWWDDKSEKTRLPDCKTTRGISNFAKRKTTSSEECRPSKLRTYIVPQRVREPITSSRNSYLSSTRRPSFRKVLRKGATHTAECCRLVFPLSFVEENCISLDKHVTMADSTGHKLWHMRMQECSNGPSRVISNGWREFCYDHNLKENDALKFTLVSFSHFVVEFVCSDSISTRVMYPTREVDKYPWFTNYSRIKCLSWRPTSENSQSYHLTCCPQNAKKIEEVIQFRSTQGKPGGHGIKTLTWHHRHPQDALMIPTELTYLECKNPDGSAYFQILDSDDENEVVGSDDEDEAKRSQERSKRGAAQTCRICSEARKNQLVVSQTAKILKSASQVVKFDKNMHNFSTDPTMPFQPVHFL